MTRLPPRSGAFGHRAALGAAVGGRAQIVPTHEAETGRGAAAPDAAPQVPGEPVGGQESCQECGGPIRDRDEMHPKGSGARTPVQGLAPGGEYPELLTIGRTLTNALIPADVDDVPFSR